MANSALQQEQMRRYLLGDMADAEKDALDAVIFGDDENFDRMWEIENDLVDCYLRGRLSQAERDRFERHYLASQKHRERVAFAKSLLKAADEERISERTPTSSFFARLAEHFRPPQLALTGAMAMALLLMGVWTVRLMIERNRLEAELGQANSANEARQRQVRALEKNIAQTSELNEKLNAELQQSKQNKAVPAASAPSFITFLLTSTSLVRNENQKMPELQIPANADQVRLRVQFLRGAYKSCQVEIRNPDTGSLWRQSRIEVKSNKNLSSVIALVPSAKLPQGDYTLALSGVTTSGETKEIDRYPFRVIRRF